MNNLQFPASVVLTANGRQIALFAATTVVFCLIARALRGVTTSGSVAGGVVCFLLMLAAGWGGFAALCTVFVLTWAATRLGYRRKQELGSAEARAGRSAAQVLANLSVAGVVGILYLVNHDSRLLAAAMAALAEVAADTLSSEIGLVLGGTPRLVTTWKAVPPGTNGAITAFGTLAGVCAAGIIALVSTAGRVLAIRVLPVCIVGALAGTVADSILGATLERKGSLGNNSVNFLSTAVAALVVWLLA